MTQFRWLAILAALIIAVPSLAPSPADARAGSGGSRGSKSGQAPAPTQTAPTSKPVERSATPQQQSPSANPASAAAAGAKPGGFMSRNPFLSGLMGGMLGAGLIGMMMGGGFGAGLGSMAGMLGFLLQLALIGGIVYFGVRWWKSRNGAPQAAFAGAGAGAGGPGGAMGGNPPTPAPDSMARTGLMGGMLGGAGAASAASATQQLAIGEDDYNAFEALLVNVQAAYSAGDLAKLRGLVSPEMLGYFSQDLSANASRGVENRIESVKLEQGDLSEAWSEGAVDYASVAMRFSMIDVMRNVADGRIVEGNEQVRTEATEVWTFLRSRGGNWILSAIQNT
jgi:predicted lipid-binding transport protein (Tim44 family)